MDKVYENIEQDKAKRINQKHTQWSTEVIYLATMGEE